MTLPSPLCSFFFSLSLEHVVLVVFWYLSGYYSGQCDSSSYRAVPTACHVLRLKHRAIAKTKSSVRDLLGRPGFGLWEGGGGGVKMSVICALNNYCVSGTSVRIRCDMCFFLQRILVFVRSTIFFFRRTCSYFSFFFVIL